MHGWFAVRLREPPCGGTVHCGMPYRKGELMQRTAFLLIGLLACAPEDDSEEPSTTKPRPQGPETSADKDGTRLRRYRTVTTGTDGTRIEELSAIYFRDVKLNADCNPRDIGDGSLICMPLAAVINNAYYSDNKCTMRVEAVFVSTPCVGDPKLPEWSVSTVSSARPSCSTQYVKFYRGATFSKLAAVYSLSGTTCVESNFGGSGSYYAVDTSKATSFLPSDFVAITRTVELQ